MKNRFYCSVEYKTAAMVCTFKIINTPLTTVQLALLMTNEQTGKLFKEKRNSQELSRKELRLAGVQFSDYRGSPTSIDSTSMEFQQQPRTTIRGATAGKAPKALALPRFWGFQYALIRNNRSKNLG